MHPLLALVILVTVIHGVMLLLNTVSGKVYTKMQENRYERNQCRLSVPPPKGMNSAIVEFLYKGCTTTIGVRTLILYLANTGYIRIEETYKRKRGPERGYVHKLIWVKPFEVSGSLEQLFLEILFGEEKECEWHGVSDEMYYKFRYISDQINEKEKNRYPEETKKNVHEFIGYMKTLKGDVNTFQKRGDQYFYEILPFGLAVGIINWYYWCSIKDTLRTIPNWYKPYGGNAHKEAFIQYLIDEYQGLAQPSERPD